MMEEGSRIVEQQRLMREKIERAKRERERRKEEEEREEAARKERLRLKLAALGLPLGQESKGKRTPDVVTPLQEVGPSRFDAINDDSRQIIMTENSESNSQWLVRQRDTITRRMTGVYDLHEKALAAEFSRRDQEREREKVTLSEEVTRLKQEKQLMSEDLSKLKQETESFEARNLRLEQEKRALSDHVAKVIIQASAAEELQRENARLLEEVESLKSYVATAFHQTPDKQVDRSGLRGPTNEAEPPSSSGATVPTQEATVPYKDYHELTVKYNQCIQQMETYRQAHSVMTEKYRASKERLKEWDAWLKRSREKKARPERTSAETPAPGSHTRTFTGELPSPSTPKTIPEKQGELEPAPASPEQIVEADELTPRAVFRSSTYIELPEAAMDREEPSAADAGSKSPPRAGPHALEHDDQALPGNPSSSQTTQDDGGHQLPREHIVDQTAMTDEDIPIVVSTRSLKRKRPYSRGKSGIHIYDDAEQPDGTSTRPIRIKEEPPSSPVVTATQHLTRTGTLDLDTAGTDSDTPRKRRIRELLQQSQRGSHRSGARSKLRQERCSSVPMDTQSQLRQEGARRALEHGSGAAKPKGLGRCDSDPTSILDERVIAELTQMGPELENHQNRNPRKRRRVSPLQPLDPNTRVLPRTGLNDTPTRKRRDNDKGAKWIHLLSEDGDVKEKAPSSDGPKAKSLAAKAESHQRLSALLERQTTAKGSVSTDRTPATDRTRRNQSPLTAVRPSSKPPVSDQTPQAQFITPRSALNEGRATPTESSRRPAERLRNRPLQQLRLSDFKINPRYNQGLDHLFVDTVRGRDARRCLPGCTRPECCGGVFRAMAEAGAGADLAHGLWDSSQDADDEERLLKYLMGDQYDRQRIAEMSAEEKQELLVQARTKLLADRHGKHRHAFERSKTPPGYWRTDMPTTQEIEEDREKAKQYERERVEAMYAEAMREGGAWIFRDE